MNNLSLTTDQVKNLVDLVQQKFPGWKGFSDPEFEKEEVDYKQVAVQKAKELLNENDLNNLVQQEKYEEFKDRLIKVAQSAKNLLYLAAPSSGDLSVLFSNNLKAPSFYDEFINLIYGSEPSSDRLEKFSSSLKINKLPDKWTFPTFFLFMCHPNSEIFVKRSNHKLVFGIFWINQNSSIFTNS